MNNKEMNQAIYAKMCEIADKWFNTIVEKSETLRNKMEEKRQITAKELFSSERRWENPLWNIAIAEAEIDTWPSDKIEVGGFKCEFFVCDDNFYQYMKVFQYLAKAKEHVFTYGNESRMDFIAEEEIRFNPADAKRLASFCGKDELYPQFMLLHVEYNKSTAALALVACNTHIMAIMSTDDSIIASRDEENTIEAHISVNDWKRLCDEEKRTNEPARFYIFPDAIEVGCGDVRISSTEFTYHYPNCQSVIPDKSQMHHIVLRDDEIKPFNSWLRKTKVERFTRINVSVYAGNDMMYVDIIDIEHSRRTTKMFRLADTSQVTLGVTYNGEELKRLKPSGFYVGENDHCLTCVDDCSFDCVLLTQITDTAHTFDVEKREVLALAECA